MQQKIVLLIGEEQFLPFHPAPWSITACFQVCAEIAQSMHSPSQGLAVHHNFNLPYGCLAHHRSMKTLLLTFALTTGLLAQAPFQVKITGHGRPMILIPGLSSPGRPGTLPSNILKTASSATS
jgi:hypothetical protein